MRSLLVYPRLPQTCERALLERFLRAEAMAMWAVRSAQAQEVPPHVLRFLQRHETDEQRHLQQFEELLGTQACDKLVLPRAPGQWWALAVHLYGYETLGLEFANLLVGLRPDLTPILKDEEVHVGFFEREIRHILAGGAAALARGAARAWWRRIPQTVSRYLRGDQLDPYRTELHRLILARIEERFAEIGLLDRSPSPP